MTSILENTANSLPTYYLTLIRKRFLSYSTFASRQSPAVKYIISRSEVIAHPHHLTLPLPKSLPSGEGLAFTASSEEEWCFANAKLEFLMERAYKSQIIM